MNLLSECFRVLRQEGKIRIATPDLRFLIDLYNPEKTKLQERYISWAIDTFLPDIKIYRDVFVINNFFRAWGHKFIYDYELLQNAMNRAGFINITPHRVGESDDKSFQGLEAHEQIIPDEFNKLETFVVEGTKPD